jgi:transcriptional regulator with XRE-family HTH domain
VTSETTPEAASEATVAERLREAMEEAGRLSNRGLARLLAGEGADHAKIEAKRRQVNRWLSGRHQPSDESARTLAAVLGRPPDYFMGARYPGASIGEVLREVRSLGERVVASFDPDLAASRQAELLRRLDAQDEQLRVLTTRADEILTRLE